MKIGDNILYKIDEHPDLLDNPNISLELAANLQSFYVSPDSNIPEIEILKIIGKSKLDDKITLMPIQMKFLKAIEKSKKIILSAPTSFGKTFIAMEHIKRNLNAYNTIFYIVHTNSLKDELMKKFLKYFGEDFEIYDNIDVKTEAKKKIFILVSDGQNIINYEEIIDLLVVDEAYNLNNEQSKERYYCIMQSYYSLLNNADKIILLGPFISDKSGDNAKEFDIVKTDFSPVGTKINDICSEDAKPIDLLIEKISDNENVIGYFNSKNEIYSQAYIINERIKCTEKNIDKDIIDMFNEEFPDYWIIPKLMKNRIGIYHSGFPQYINLYCMWQFNNGKFSGLLTTSSILEGVNTSAKNLIIFNTKDGKNELTPFRFFNLCGRVGRLGKEIIGNVYNFGRSYEEQYKEKELVLVIGCNEINSEYEDYDEIILNNEFDDNNKVEKELRKSLNDIDINYEEKYPQLSFYSQGSKDFEVQVKEYLKFKVALKEFLNNEKSKTKGGEIDKNKLVKFIYESYIQSVNKSYKPSSNCGFSAKTVLPLVLRSRYNGIDINIKLFMNKEIECKSFFKELDEINKNNYLAELFRFLYDYIPHNFYNCIYLLNEFIQNDGYFTNQEKSIFRERFFISVENYLFGKYKEYILTAKCLKNMGFLPRMVEKIIYFLRTNNIEDNVSRKELIGYIRNCSEEIGFSKIEKKFLEIIID